MSFQQRRDLGRFGERLLEAYFDHHRYPFWRSGIENLVPDIAPRVCQTLPPSLRFLPDYNVSLNGHLVWVELKTSLFIEREAFTSYLEIDGRQPVYLCFYVKRTLSMVRVTDLVFRTPDTTRPDHMPTDGIWKQPSKWDQFADWKKRNPNASGSDYAEIDPAATPLRPLTMPTPQAS